MPEKDPNNIKAALDVVETVMLAGFAGFAGMMAYVMRALNNHEKPNLCRLIIEAGASAFVGILAMLVCKALDLSWEWSGVIVGIFGWMGAEASIAMLTKVVRNKLGIGDKNANPDS